MDILTPAERIFCAIDTTDLNQAVELAQALKGAVGGFKLGKEFFTANGPDGVARISELGQRIFLDLKFHDIPNTVAGLVVTESSGEEQTIRKGVVIVEINGQVARDEKDARANLRRGLNRFYVWFKGRYNFLPYRIP